MSDEEIRRIPPEVAERLGHYVYLLIDPRTGKPFYVGKGQGQRVLSHLGLQDESRKVNLIRELTAEGKRPRLDILAHDLPNDKAALLVEAAVIDALELADLTNEVRGTGAIRHGRTPLSELIATYAAKPVEIVDPCLLIRINRLYQPAMEGDALYEATRGTWKIGDRRNRVRFAMPVYEGVVRAVYEIEEWHPAGSTDYATRERAELTRVGRWEFSAHPASVDIQDKYVGRSVARYLPPGMRAPFVYVNC